MIVRYSRVETLDANRPDRADLEALISTWSIFLKFKLVNIYNVHTT